jgi:hypothetical protein
MRRSAHAKPRGTEGDAEKKQVKKLTLNKETLKNLTTRQLDRVAGGVLTLKCTLTTQCTGG